MLGDFPGDGLCQLTETNRQVACLTGQDGDKFSWLSLEDLDPNAAKNAATKVAQHLSRSQGCGESLHVGGLKALAYFRKLRDAGARHFTVRLQPEIGSECAWCKERTEPLDIRRL
jgi:hypothetical protein